LLGRGGQEEWWSAERGGKEDGGWPSTMGAGAVTIREKSEEQSFFIKQHEIASG
jgi:hypothetical protein